MSAAEIGLRRGVALRSVFSTLVAGCICGFLAIVLSIGHGSLLFASQFREFLPVSIGLGLFSTAVMAAVAAFTSSTRGVVAIAQEIPVVAQTTVIAAVAAALPAAADGETRLATILASVAVSTALAGLVALLLGYFRLGRLIRFVPYPVIGGFLAGTGWLIAIGGIGLVINEAPSVGFLSRLGEPTVFAQTATTALFVAALFAGQSWRSNALVLPMTILAALVLFNIGALISGAGTENLRAEGWLIALPESGTLWPPLGLADLSGIDWSAVAAGALGMPTVAVLTVMALLMNATGIELDSNRDVDLDRELKSVGLMNIVAAPGFGLSGYHSVSLSLLASRLGAATQWVGIIVALLTASSLAFGAVVLDAVPTVVLGGVLIWIGGSLIVEWLIRAYRHLDKREYLVILLIFAVIVGIDFAIGILVGLIAAIVLFAFEYGRLDVVRHEISGADYQSGVETVDARREALREHGDAIMIVMLRGFLFFGTADTLRRRIENRIAEAGDRRIRFLVIDVARVTGIDSSGVLSFVRLQQIAEREDLEIVICGATPATADALLRGRSLAPDSRNLRLEADFERGLKWCEDRLLDDMAPDRLGRHDRKLDEFLTATVKDAALAGKIGGYFRRVEASAGTRLIEEGTRCDTILFIEGGHAAIEAAVGNGHAPIRLAIVGPGAIVGEIAFYLGEMRTASVVAQEKMIVWELSRDSLDRFQAETPDAALAFHTSLAAMLARRLRQANNLVRMLAD